jgi:hypothetical protein
VQVFPRGSACPVYCTRGLRLRSKKNREQEKRSRRVEGRGEMPAWASTVINCRRALLWRGCRVRVTADHGTLECAVGSPPLPPSPRVPLIATTLILRLPFTTSLFSHLLMCSYTYYLTRCIRDATRTAWHTHLYINLVSSSE